MLINNQLITTFIVGFTSTALGMLIGLSLSLLVSNKAKICQGIVLGLVSGIMISMLVLDLLPEAFSYYSTLVGLLGLIIGLICARVMDINFEASLSKSKYKKRTKKTGFKTGSLISVSIIVHDILVGTTLGSILCISFKQGINLAFILCIEATLDGLSMAIPFLQSGVRTIKIIIISIIVSFPLGIGSFLGGLFHMPPIIISLSLGFASGFVLYITFFNVLPISKKMPGGRAAIPSSIAGIIAGIILLNYI